MSRMEHFAALAILLMVSSSPLLAQEQKPENAQESQDHQDHYVPPLNSLMMLTQLGHFKLWYAGAVQKWPLANYEFGADPSQYCKRAEALSQISLFKHVDDDAAGG